MSLNKMSLGTVVKKQYQYKLKAYAGVFSSLVLLQCFALLFSLGGSGSGMSGAYGVSIHTSVYSSLNVIVFTFLWAFINSIIMTTKKDGENGFTFVSNRLSNNLSNALFLVAASIVGGVTAILSGYLLRVIIYFFTDAQPILDVEFVYQPMEVFSGIVAMVLYLFLLCSVGYLLGMITQIHRTLPVVLPVLIIGILIATQERSGYLFRIAEFYFQEYNFLLFVVKIIITSIICFMGAVLISNRMEVRK